MIGSIDGSIKVWSLNKQSSNTLSLKYTSNQQKAAGITSIVTTQDGSIGAVCYQDSIIRFYDLHDCKEINYIDPGLFEAFSLSLSPADDLLVSGNMKGKYDILPV